MSSNKKIIPLSEIFFQTKQKIELDLDFSNKIMGKPIESLTKLFFRSKETDPNGVKKLIYNIENKINYIYNMFLGDSEEDATIARRNWFCLSCDRKLDKYQGKVGNHLISNQLKSKTL